MRTNIDIDDKLMDYVMAKGEFKTKREAVDAGLKLIKRRYAYAAIRAARGTLFWDDSDEAWARSRAEAEAQAVGQAAATARVSASENVPQAQDNAALAVSEPVATYQVTSSTESTLPSPVPGARKRRNAVSGAKP